MTLRLTASAIFLSCTAIAGAQVAVPPSAPVAPTKEFVPPPPPVMKPFDPKSVQASPTLLPGPAAVTLPDLPYESLAKRDASGNLPALTEPVEWAALRINPTITAEGDKERVKQILADRLKQYQTIVIESIDFMHQIDDGLLEKLDVTGAGAKADVIKVRALAGKGTLVKALKDSKVLTDIQIRFNQKISEERTKAEFAPAAKADNPEDQKKKNADGVGKSVLRQAVAEAMHARRVLFIAAAATVGEVGPANGLTGEQVKTISAAKTDDAKFEAVRSTLHAMPVEKQREFLKAVAG